MSIVFNRIADTVTRLTSTSEPVALDRLARLAHMSPFHFQRTFTRLVGMSPLRFQQVVRVQVARELLGRSSSVLHTALEAGFSGPSRLHDAMIRVERMTPGEFKAGTHMHWAKAETELGTLTVAATSRGLCAASFFGIDDLRARWPRSTFTRNERTLRPEVKALEARLRGQRMKAPLPLVLAGTTLQVAVWRALLDVPEGAVTTYGALAKCVGNPRAARAVASAVASNPIAWLIPCHRVLRSSGVQGEYRWGAARKAMLLAREWNALAAG